MLNDFVVVDFETANSRLNSACSIGLVVVSDLKIVETDYHLIKPPGMKFDPKNTEIHGISPQDVINESEFPDVWESVQKYFFNSLIVAHNAVFDMSVLKNSLVEYDLEQPFFHYLCSMRLSNDFCGREKISGSLKDRSAYFGIKLENHHNALDDALACANLVIKCIQKTNADSLTCYCSDNFHLVKKFNELKPIYSINAGRKKSFVPKYKNISPKDITPVSNKFDESHIFFNKNIVFTGELSLLDRKTAMQLVVEFGGKIKTSVTRVTDYLVIGKQDEHKTSHKGTSVKEEKAYELIEKGYEIKILHEREFYEIIVGKK